jgi:hypothetical protein
MEPGGSLPHSQEPATCPCPEPAQSSPCPPTLHALDFGNLRAPQFLQKLSFFCEDRSFVVFKTAATGLSQMDSVTILFPLGPF